MTLGYLTGPPKQPQDGRRVSQREHSRDICTTMQVEVGPFPGAFGQMVSLDRGIEFGEPDWTFSPRILRLNVRAVPREFCKIQCPQGGDEKWGLHGKGLKAKAGASMGPRFPSPASITRKCSMFLCRSVMHMAYTVLGTIARAVP